MNKYLIFLLALSGILICSAQEFDFYPINENNVPMSKFTLANTILEETVSQVNERKGSYNYANLWNIAVAYQLLGKEALVIKEILNRSKKEDSYYFSLTFVNPENSFSKWKGTFTQMEYTNWYKEAQQIVKSYNVENLNREQSIVIENESENYNKELVEILTSIRKNDLLYRSSKNIDLKKQMELDKRNMKIIDSIYSVHKKYIGKSIVGEDLSSTMWAVIQHSNLNKMEEYLPVIVEAINEGELNRTVLKLLIDRIHTIKFNTQIFGSQIGVPIASDTIVIEIRKKYGFPLRSNSKESLNDWFKQKN